jgi:hypothetical protein
MTDKNPTDIEISKLVGLETYKALYTLYPNLYSYISDPLTPTLYFTDLVQGVVASSGLTYEKAGEEIYSCLENYVSLTRLESKHEITGDAKILTLNITYKKELNSFCEPLIEPLIKSSFPVENLNPTFWENALWIILATFLAFFIVFYLYTIGFFHFVFNEQDGIACLDCKSMFDYIRF